MSSLPLGARIYAWLVLFLGFAALLGSQTIPLPRSPHSPWELIAFSTAALLIGGRKLNLNKLRKNEAGMSMTVGFAITFATLVRLGPGPAVPISILGCLSSCLYPQRQPAHQLGFNISLSAIEAFLSGLVFAVFNGWTMDLEPAKTFTAVAAACALLFLMNTGGVSKMISLCTGESALLVWKENFAWTAPGYFASASVGALSVIYFHANTVAVMLFALPIGYVVYQLIATHIASAEEHKAHIAALEAKQAELERLYLATIESLALAVEAKDTYTHEHIIRVQRYAAAIAKEMGLDGVDLQGVRTGALLHDIGKLGIPEQILMKPGALTSEEYAQVKLHPEIGAAILGPVALPWPVLPSVRHHHERWNGSGYPDGLAGEAIPLTARIMAVADVYDALTSTRSYREARPHEQALEVIRNEAGLEFDPAVVEAFERVIGQVVAEMAATGSGPLSQWQPVAKVISASEPIRTGGATQPLFLL